MSGEAAFEVTVLVVMNGISWFLIPDVGQETESMMRVTM